MRFIPPSRAACTVAQQSSSDTWRKTEPSDDAPKPRTETSRPVEPSGRYFMELRRACMPTHAPAIVIFGNAWIFLDCLAGVSAPIGTAEGFAIRRVESRAVNAQQDPGGITDISPGSRPQADHPGASATPIFAPRQGFGWNTGSCRAVWARSRSSASGIEIHALPRRFRAGSEEVRDELGA